MRRPSREITIISISALDLFASALGVFMLLSVLSMTGGRKVDEMELCFVVDFTGSMEGSIGELRDDLERAVRVLQRLSPRLSVGIVAYRDRADEVFVTREFPLTLIEGPADVDRLERWLEEVAALEFGTNPEPPEAVQAGLEQALAMRWSSTPGLPQVIVVVGDVAAYPEEADATFEIARRFAAGGRRRKVSAIWCDTIDWGRVGNDPERKADLEAFNEDQRAYFRRLAEAGNGQFMVADQMLEAVLVSVIEKER